MTVSRGPLAGACGLLLVLYARASHADVGKEAERLFDDGVALLKEGKADAACPKLEASNKLEPGVGVQLWLANCYERTGRVATAYRQYLAAEALAAAAKDARDKVAHKRATDLEPRLTRLSVVIEAGARVDGLVVTRDGEAVAAGGEPAFVDPGSHVVRATAPGYEPFEATVALSAEGAQQVVRVGALAPLPGTRTSFYTPLRIAGIASASVGLALIGTGVVFGLMASDALDASNAGGHCDAKNTCDPIGLQLRSNALTDATLSTVGFVAGGVLVAGGVAALAWPRAHAKGTTSVSVVPLLAAGTAGFAAAGVF